LSANDDLQQKLKAGVDAAKRGDRITARRLLEQVVQADERNEMAWIWLASAVNTVAERRACLERVLEINPRNERAAEALRRLDAGGDPRDSAEEARARQTISQVRQAQSSAPSRSAGGGRAFTPPPTPAATGSGGGLAINTTTLILIGVVAAVILGAAALSSALGGVINQPTATPTAEPVAAQPTPNFTPTPLPTITGAPLAAITRSAPTLPPTLTPSRTPSPTLTPEPTFEPTPLALFELIYTSLNPGADQPDVYRIQADGSAESFMIEFARDAVYAPDGQSIAFVRDVGPAPAEAPVEGEPEGETEAEAGAEGDAPAATGVIAEIFITRFDDLGTITQVTSLGAVDTSRPSWSPDGTQIVFSSSYQSDNPELWIINADGSDLRRLTENAVADREPAWSPVDPTRIVYTSDADFPGEPEIYLLALPEAGSEGAPTVTQLTNSGGASYSPAWSPDGTTIVFASDRGGAGDIYVMDANGEGEALVTSNDGPVENRAPSISRDGRWVAFISNREGEFQTYVTLLATGEVLRVTNSPRADFTVQFRP
jgi:hypothetical protein